MSTTWPPTIPAVPAASVISARTRGNDLGRRLAQAEVDGDEAERVGQERVPGEDRHRLAEDLVAREPPAAVVVVVHGGQVVVDQRVGVDQLEGSRRWA